MALQDGILKIKGLLDNISFYKTADGYLVRRKSGVSGDRIKNDPAFQRTRENLAEFGRAGKASKHLRAALRPVVRLVADRRMISRLTKEFMRVVKSDPSSSRGQRSAAKGNIALLQGFEFNAASPLSAAFHAPFASSIDRAGGTISVSIPSFVPANMISAPAGATHFRLMSSGAEVDFDAGTFTSNVVTTDLLPINLAPTEAFNLETLIPPGSTHALFLVLGIDFYQEVNNEFSRLSNGAFNGLSLVTVSKGV